MAMTKDELFSQPLYMLHVTGWPAEAVRPPDPLQKPVVAPAGARLALWPADPADQRHIPPPGPPVTYQTDTFSLVNSGNRTLWAPKRSWKADLTPDGEGERLAGMDTVNLKAMYNDPSQLREALAWRLFARAGVPASRHTYAKLALNDTYPGLFSVIEQVDKRYLKDRFMASPYFTFIPWDYDNSFGIDFFDTRWQDTDLVDWAASTASYGRRNSGGRLSRIPLVQHLLRNRDFLRYYLDHVEFLLDTELNPDAVAALIGAGGGLWDRVSRPAYLESDTPHGSPFTGRQFTNHEVYRSNTLQEELRRGEETAQGVVHYVRMRHDSARAQLAALRRDHPAGSGGAAFPATLEPLP
jgi:hypothetical protein